MAFQTWQVGLDIQNGQLCALGIQRRRNGWQLRHWWQHTLPQDTLRNGLVQRPDVVAALLRRWCKQLPRNISLRVGFPPQLVMQRQLAVPTTQLREPEYSHYINAATRRFFPIEPEALALDYRIAGKNNGQLYLTATRQEALHSWVSCLQQASLTPQVLELTPAALAVLARLLTPESGDILVHRLSDHWLWYGPRQAENPWGWCSLTEVPDFTTLQQRYLLADGANGANSANGKVWFSSAIAEAPPQGTIPLLPLDAIPFFQPPLPASSGAFALAVGLALRPEDR